MQLGAKRLKKIFTFLCVWLLAAVSFCQTAGATLSYDSYVYTYWGEARQSPFAFLPAKSLRIADDKGLGLNGALDIVTGPNGNIYIADTGNNRIVILDENLSYRTQITTFSSKDNQADTFKMPSGVFVTDQGDLYVADTENSRIVVFNPELKCKQIFSAPVSKLFADDFIYKPTSVAVDHYGRIYVISLNNLLGVISLTETGEFDGFIGVQKVVANPLDLLWRKFMTEEQIARTRQFIPTEFSNLTVDQESFLFATIESIPSNSLYAEISARSSSSDYSPIKKLSPSGIDVLTRNGFFPPVGDIDVSLGDNGEYVTSLIGDVAVCDNGVYSLLDKRCNRIFSYDEDGNLLYAFGGTGIDVGQFQSLISIVYQGKNILCLDKATGAVTQFIPTEYGEKINQALERYRLKDFDGSNDIWAELADYNNNLDIAYVGLGKSSYRAGDYGAAMEYFKEANDIKNYSKAFSEQRNQWVRKYFPLLLIGMIAIVFLIYLLFKKSKEYNQKVDFIPGKKTMRQKLMYSFYILFHPFDGFYEIKHRGRGDVGSATVLLMMATASYVVYKRYSGYIFNYQTVHDFNFLYTCLTVIIPVFVWTVANWSLTCLSDGEGSLSNIYVSTCYSLTPLILFLLPLTLFSNVMLMEEAVFYNFISGFAFVYTLALIFASNMIIHHFTLPKNIITLLLSVVAMVVIAFLCVLFGVLLQKMASFVVALFTEISFRL